MVETTTVNYGWTKPEVGASIDNWGGYINSDLDGIDTTVKGVSNVANAAYPASNPSGYQTAAQVTASLAPYALTASVPAASSTTPAMDGTAAVGTGATFARADHVHPSDTSRLALAGGTMMGPIVLAADPAANLQPATKQYVDGGRLGDNRIINGDMRIDQRNNGASGTPVSGAYVIDRWLYGCTQASKFTSQRIAAGANLVSLGFGYFLAFTSLSAYASVASDQFYFTQPIEADFVSDFAWGTSGAQPVTLSFWAYSTLTGTFSGALTNYPGPPTRSYPFTFSIPVASTWTKIVVTIPGDTTGTWAMNGNSGGLYVRFDLGCGSTFRATAGAWTAGNYIGATGAVSVVGTNGANLYITGVKLEIGSVATPFNRQSLAKSMADCQRYYFQAGALWLGGYALATVSCGSPVVLPATMRATPTITFPTNINLTNCAAPTVLGLTASNFSMVTAVTASGSFICNVSVTANAEL